MGPVQGTVPACSFSCSTRRPEGRLRNERPVCVQTTRRRPCSHVFRKTGCSSKRAQTIANTRLRGNSRTTHLGPFGELIRATGPMAKVNPFLFSTKFYDWETGLYYYGYRYYNPSSGRWLSRDLAEEDGGLNLYAILGNDPVGDVDYLGLVDYKFDIVVGTPRTIGDVGEWGQPAKSATGSTNVSGKTATSSVTITSRTKPAHGSGSGACNTVDGGDWGQDVASRHDAGTINLYVRNDCPGYFDIFIDGSMQLTATGPYLAAPAASITDGNGRIQASGNGNVKKPFSLSTSFVVPLHLGSDWTLAATYDPKVTVGPDTGKKATGTATGSITFVDARPH